MAKLTTTAATAVTNRSEEAEPVLKLARGVTVFNPNLLFFL
jgi:hypothetical protein